MAAGQEQAREILSQLGDERAGRVSVLESQRRDMKRQQQILTAQIKLESRKMQRLLDKARGLSDSDLLSVVATRAAAKAKASTKAKGKAGARCVS